MSPVWGILTVGCVQHIQEGMADSGMSLRLRREVGSKIVTLGGYWRKEAV